jgi:hypothetical protein
MPKGGYAYDWGEIPAQPKVAGRPCDHRHVQVPADHFRDLSKPGTPSSATP